MNFNLESKISDSENINKIHETIQTRFDQERPNPIDFYDILSREMIDHDMRRVEKQEQKWLEQGSESDRENKKRSDIAEYIIYKNLGTWIDYQATILPTSKPDDYLRGVDLIIESEDLDTTGNVDHVGLGIDIALTTQYGESKGLENKKEKMKQRLLSGELTEARYVSGGSFTGSIPDLSYIILSVSSSHVYELMPSVLNKNSNQIESNHLLKYITAFQFLFQLETYFKISAKKGYGNTAHSYGKAQNFIFSIMGSTYQEIVDNEELQDRVFKDPGTLEIYNFCNSLKQEFGIE